MKALRLQVLHTCVVSRGHTPFDGSLSLSVNTTRNSGPKRPRRLVCFASTVINWWRVLHLQAKGRSGSDTSKLPCCTRRSYIFRVFSRYICLLHTSINYTENVRIFTRMRKQWIPGALLRFFKRLGTRLDVPLAPLIYTLALVRPEELKQTQLVHSLAQALTLTLTHNHLANKPQRTAGTLFGLIMQHKIF